MRKRMSNKCYLASIFAIKGIEKNTDGLRFIWYAYVLFVFVLNGVVIHQSMTIIIVMCRK